MSVVKSILVDHEWFVYAPNYKGHIRYNPRTMRFTAYPHSRRANAQRFDDIEPAAEWLAAFPE